MRQGQHATVHQGYRQGGDNPKSNPLHGKSPDDPFHAQGIVIATDLSDSSLRAVQYGCGLAGQFGAEVHLLHVVHYPYAEFAKACDQNFCSTFDEYEEQHAESAAQALSRVDVAPLSDVTRVARSGFPVADIPRYADEVHADLLVLGTHGWTGLTHALMGSVCEAVVRRAKCPVLSVRAE